MQITVDEIGYDLRGNPCDVAVTYQVSFLQWLGWHALEACACALDKIEALCGYSGPLPRSLAGPVCALNDRCALAQLDIQRAGEPLWGVTTDHEWTNI